MKLKNILTMNSYIFHINFSLPNLSNLQFLYRPQNVIMAAALFQMGLCLNTIGFTTQNDRDKLHEEGLTDLVQLKRFTEKDIRGMATTLSKRSTAAARLIVGMVRLQNLITLMYQYGYRSCKLQRQNYTHCTWLHDLR